MINVLIRRVIPKGADREVLTLIAQLRAEATHTKGYISSEIVWNMENEREYVSMTKWRSPEAWQAWKESTTFRELQNKLDEKGCKTSYEKFIYPLEEYTPMPML